MDKRQQELTRLRADTDNIEKEVTLLIQNLQWDPKRITEKRPLVACKHDSNHRVPMDDWDNHEKQCYLTKLGYRKEDTLLPDPVDPGSNTLVKFSKHQIAEIINNAAVNNPLFKRGCPESEPLSVERLQHAYSADERRAIHDAVVTSAPYCHDLAELELLSSNDDAKTSQKKSRLEILAELRDMKRRRTKYRVPPKTRNYSDVLRDVIKTQMDSYGESSRTIIKTEYGPNIYVSQKVSNIHSEIVSPCDVVIKLEREFPEPHCSNRNTGEYPRDRNTARIRENKYNDDRKGFRKENFQIIKEKNMGPQSELYRSYSTEKSREKSYNDQRSHHADKYSSRERSKKYNVSHRSDNFRDFAKDKSRYDDDRYTYRKDYSSKERNSTYESCKRDVQTRHDVVVKQERESPESESHMDYSRDRHRDKSRSSERRHHHPKKAHIKKHSKDERKDKHDDKRKNRPERYNPEKVVKEEVESPEYDSFNSGETSRKRQRSRSKERKKGRHEKDKYSSKRVKEESKNTN